MCEINDVGVALNRASLCGYSRDSPGKSRTLITFYMRDAHADIGSKTGRFIQSSYGLTTVRMLTNYAFQKWRTGS